MMGLRAWITGIVRAVDVEYDRRIKRASGVVAYGTQSHDHENADEGEEAQIVNIPPGTLVHHIGEDSPSVGEAPAV